MTSLTVQSPELVVSTHSLVTAVEQVAADLQASCLVETRDGRVIAHSVVGPIPEAAVAAVVSRTSQPLQSSAVRRRTVAVSRGGGIQEVELSDWPGCAVTSPILAMGTPLGWLWVLLEEGRELEATALRSCTTALGHAAAGGVVPGSGELHACLEGAEGAQLPAALQHGVDQLWVCAVAAADGAPGAVVAGLIDIALRDVPATPLRRATAAMGSTAYLVLGGSAAVTQTAVLAAVDDLLSLSELRLQAGLSGAVSPGPLHLRRGRIQADEALTVADVPGRAMPISTARSAIVLRHLCRSLDHLPDLGAHPLTGLLDYDDRHGGVLAPTLLAWLDAHGDRLRVAELLAIHVNTVGYRIGRARAVLDLDLDDPTVRLELHLRLRAALVDRGDS